MQPFKEFILCSSLFVLWLLYHMAEPQCLWYQRLHGTGTLPLKWVLHLSDRCTQLNDSIFVLPSAIYSLFHGFTSICTAVAPSLSLDQRHGTCSETTCMTCKLTVFIVHWRRRFFLNSTRHIECIRGVIFLVMMRYINLHLQSKNGIAVPW